MWVFINLIWLIFQAASYVVGCMVVMIDGSSKPVAHVWRKKYLKFDEQMKTDYQPDQIIYFIHKYAELPFNINTMVGCYLHILDGKSEMGALTRSGYLICLRQLLRSIAVNI